MKQSETESTKYIPGHHCSTCRGYGYTEATATEIRKGRNGVYTYKQGSGCPGCHGVGRVSLDDEIRRLLSPLVTRPSLGVTAA